jgi:hypothetical protein
MSSSKVIPNDAKDQFWSVVEACLVEFHHKPRARARSQVYQFRKKVEDLPTKEAELLYHSEPFDVACRLANHPLEVGNYLTRYLQIRDSEDEE